jgi:hypothetical protein
MLSKRLILTFAISLILPVSAWAQFSMIQVGNPPATFQGKNWHDALEQVPCNLVAKDGEVIKINATLIVDGKTFQNPISAEESQVRQAEALCKH